MADIIDTAEMPWGESLVRQRGGDIAHKRLFEGEEHSPDNYMLVLAREVAEFYSPRHRHPWDQVRFCLEGSIPIGAGLLVEGGEVAYFPESVPYGPQVGGTDRIVLLFQFGGASGQGFIGPDRLNAAREALSKKGRFEKGYLVPEEGGKPARQDAYAAIWEHVTGAPLGFADPVYKAPIVMRPSALPWRPGGQPGTHFRMAGAFPHRGLVIAQWRLDPGARMELPALEGLRFLFVLSGEGRLDGEAVRRHTAIRMRSGESGSLQADATIEYLMLTIAPVAVRKT